MILAVLLACAVAFVLFVTVGFVWSLIAGFSDHGDWIMTAVFGVGLVLLSGVILAGVGPMIGWIRTHGRKVGAITSLTTSIAAFYEFLAIEVGPIPTISREWQGLRDVSPIFAWILGFLALVVCLIGFAFDVWLGKHLITETRSTL
jgi:hypothetical protein